MNSRTPSSSLVESAYENLRSEVVSGRLKPGQKLKINVLAQAWEVSSGAIREALARLSSDGLVTSEPQRGFTVADMSIGELQDITQVRVEIESLCLRRAIAAGDIEWESRVVGAYHALMRAPVDEARRHAQPTRPWATAHAHFHTVLLSACDSPWLMRLREQLYIQSERYRMLAITGIPRERSLEDEHARLLDAVLKRDADQAVAIMNDHLNATTRDFLASVADVQLRELIPNTP